jgi:hypothetical protein
VNSFRSALGLVLAGLPFSPTLLAETAGFAEIGQMTQPVEWFADPNPPPSDPQRQFPAQRTPNGKLVLTASNGFFDPGIRASGTARIKDAAGDEIIGPDFAVLENWTLPGSTMRWHLWFAVSGEIEVKTHLTTTAENAGSSLTISLGENSHKLVTLARRNPTKPQGEPLSFQNARPGWHTLTIKLDQLKGTEVGKIHRLELSGPAAKDARLLRARWRPAACHARFSSSSVADPVLWVMTTRTSPKTKVSSYSPVTTPFGYFGTGFDAEGISSGSANFSLWSYGRGKPTPQSQWSHLLAAGSPRATFGSFGHEGSGVKVRGEWKPFGRDSREVTLALRKEVARPWIRWYGYYLDSKTKRFKLYAVAAKWIGDQKRIPGLNPGAFVEQPGPPQRRRCGDLLRDVHRRGWMLDKNRQWHVIDTMTTGKGEAIASKHWTITPDGWFSMGMGGMPHRPGPGKPLTLDPSFQNIPEWLKGNALTDLYRLPAKIGPRTISNITDKSCKITFSLTDLGLKPDQSATVTISYGLQDCLTFERDLGYRETQTTSWTQSTGPLPAKEGENSITLTGLSPAQTYFLRLLVKTPKGSIWSFETETVTTTP